MQLIVSALIPLVLSLLLYTLKVKTKFGKLNPILIQIVIGVLFGLCSVYATEIGSIQFAGAIVNVRDAGPALSGLLFGPVAGIVAGAIGAFDRLVIATMLLGKGAYTAYACTIAVFAAGLIGGLLHKPLFSTKKPYMLHCAVFIMVLEVCHMWLVACFHIWDLEQAILIMNRAFLPVLVINTLTVVLGVVLVSVLDIKFRNLKLLDVIKSRDFFQGRKLYYSFQFWLMLIIISAFVVNSIIVVVVFNIASFNESYMKFRDSCNSFCQVVEQNHWTGSKKEILDYADDLSSDFVYKISVLDNDYNILNKTKDIEPFIGEIIDKPQNELLHIGNDAASYIVFFRQVDNYYLVLYSYEMYENFLAYLGNAVTLGFQILIFTVVLIVVFILLKRLVYNNLMSVNSSLENITQGNLEEKISVDSHEEFKMLSRSINVTVGALKKHIDAEAERYKEDLIMAQQIQLSALPDVFPPFPDRQSIDIYAKYRSAKEVGGDFYDYYFVDKNLLCFLIADVTGKGIPAAMFMMRAKTAIKVFAEKYKDAAKTLKAANVYLCDNNKAELFVTCWICFVDVDKGIVQYASAGHNFPVFIDSEKKTSSFLKSKISLVLGGMEDTEYENSSIQLKFGDKIVLYTDGITEAHNKEGDLFDDDNLLEFCKNNHDKGVVNICESLFDTVDEFSKKTEQFDDMTAVSFVFSGDIKDNNNIWESETSVYSELYNVKEVFSFADEIFGEASVPEDIKVQCKIVIDELYSNIANHAYGIDKNFLTVKITVDKSTDHDFIKMTFIDCGEKFNPIDISEPDTTLGVDDRKVGGMGIHIVKQIVDNMLYEYKKSCNHLTVIKYIN